jgi:serine/threonine-protein kinase
MGVVWLAEDQQTGERVAAKVLKSELATDPEIVGRFIQERSALLSLDHPHVVRIRDLVVEGDELSLVMDLIEGPDLRVRLREEGTLPPAEATRLAIDVLEALAAAHDLSILHRDVKPDNVLLDQSNSPVSAKLTDFSIARLAQQTSVRMTGVLGTTEYIAPEMFTGDNAGRPVDVYGAGITLYELLAGRTPFAGSGNEYAVGYRHVNAEPPLINGAPPALMAVVSSMIAKAPANRPTATAAAEELRKLLPSLAGLAKLPKAAAPADWVILGDSELNINIQSHGAGTETIDRHATDVKGRVAEPDLKKSGPVASGKAEVISPVSGAVVTEDEGTSHAAVQRVRDRAVDVAEVLPTLDTPKNNRRLMVIIASAVAAVVVIAVVAIVALGGKSPAKTAGTTANAGVSAADSAVPTTEQLKLVTIERSATYSPSTGSATVTLKYQAGSSPITGPFFETLRSGGNCVSSPQWSPTATPDSNNLSCGWSIGINTIAADSSAQATATFPFTPPSNGSVTDALNSLLSNEQTVTDTELGTLGTGTDYAVQRLSSLDVQVQAPSALGGQLTVTVNPVWSGGNADTNDPLYSCSTSSCASPFDTPVIQQLIGSSTFSIQPDPSSPGCSTALKEQSNEEYVVDTVGPSSCELDATIGPVQGQGTFDLSIYGSPTG